MSQRIIPPFTREMRKQAKEEGKGLVSLCYADRNGVADWFRGPATRREQEIVAEAIEKIIRLGLKRHRRSLARKEKP